MTSYVAAYIVGDLHLVEEAYRRVTSKHEEKKSICLIISLKGVKEKVDTSPLKLALPY